MLACKMNALHMPLPQPYSRSHGYAPCRLQTTSHQDRRLRRQGFPMSSETSRQGAALLPSPSHLRLFPPRLSLASIYSMSSEMSRHGAALIPSPSLLPSGLSLPLLFMLLSQHRSIISLSLSGRGGAFCSCPVHLAHCLYVATSFSIDFIFFCHGDPSSTFWLPRLLQPWRLRRYSSMSFDSGATHPPRAHAAYCVCVYCCRWGSTTELYNHVLFGSQLIVIDVRDAESFKAGHVRSAINIPLSTVGSRPLIEIEDELPARFKLRRSDLVYIYDEVRHAHRRSHTAAVAHCQS
jgi:rhodanese-related sulfurtransferase